MSRRESGTCALTKKYGVYVDAHILPKALTKPSVSGTYFEQSTKGEGYRKRFSSWYDKKLVIREGEDILSRIDDLGIKALRKELLTWSSWTFYRPHFESLSLITPGYSFREIMLTNPEAVHRFFISIAWRACTSSIADMNEAFLDHERLELLRKAILSDAPLRPDFFPVSLIQLSTRGEAQNLTPITQLVSPPPCISVNLPEKEWAIVRVYVDGLIAHVHLDSSKTYAVKNPNFVGTTSKTIIPAVSYEISAQYENMLINHWETHAPFGKLRKIE